MTTTDPRPPLHAPLTPEQAAERVSRATASLDRALRDLIATHDLPALAATAQGVGIDGLSLTLVAGDTDAYAAWEPHIDTTGVVSPGPYPVGGEQLRMRVGQLAGVTTVLIVDDALQVLAARASDVTVDAERDPDTTSAAEASDAHSIRDRLAGDEGLTGDETLSVSPDAARSAPGGDD